MQNRQINPGLRQLEKRFSAKCNFLASLYRSNAERPGLEAAAPDQSRNYQ
jgi:hypothetical protein